ncbi:hypothetical protein AAMO2058_000759000 [Amorphochlora amoebiformis]
MSRSDEKKEFLCPTDTELRSLFSTFDRNEDGEISKEEFEKGMADLGIRTADKTWHYVLKNDSDNSGRINFEEFKNFVIFRNNELREIFNHLDKDKSGYITEPNLVEALEEYGLKASPSTVHGILEFFDHDEDGKVTFEEFQKLTMLFPRMDVYDILDRAADSLVIGIYNIPKSDHPDHHVKHLNIFLSGGVAGLVSRTLTAPADRLKVMMQAGGKDARISTVVSGILGEGGPTAFWRGNTANVVKIMPESAAKFYCYEYLKKKIIQNPNDVQVYERLLSGSLAGMSAQSAIYPMEVVKTRMAISKPGTYKGIPNCFSKIVRDEGIGALYKGLGASNIGIIPYAGVDLAVYGTIKDRWIKKHPNSKPAWYVTLTMGAFSSFVGQVVAYPLQLVRTKLQSSGLPGRPVYNGMRDVVSHVLKDEGVLGFYRGIGPNFLKGIPAVAIGYVAYEKSKEFFAKWI